MSIKNSFLNKKRAKILFGFICEKFLFQNIRRNNIFFFKMVFKRIRWCFSNFFLCINSIRDMINKNKRSKWQNISFARKQLRAVSDILSKKWQRSIFYDVAFSWPAWGHFFFYDIPNLELLDQEVEILDDFINSNNPKTRGNNIYWLPLCYVDFWIQKFYNKLKSMTLLEDTILVVVADHGLSVISNI